MEMLTVNRDHNTVEPQGLNADKLPLGILFGRNCQIAGFVYSSGIV